MFDHLTIRASDRSASERFYDTVLGTIGIERSPRTGGLAGWREFSLTGADEAHPPTRRLHVGFGARSREVVDEFWRVGTETGYADDGQPGPRPQYRSDYYGAFLLDPDENSVEGIHHGELRRSGIVDHVWVRVADVAAASRFYKTIAPHAGLELTDDRRDYLRLAGVDGSLSFVRGVPSENVHLAFATADESDVRRFHEAAIGAGYRTNGAPGERPEYHPGYYAAFVLDPDGNNIEVVHHQR
jgi:catechol 2,3-dioxygenase-like lactoylglutathione lyase family enzyme